MPSPLVALGSHEPLISFSHRKVGVTRPPPHRPPRAVKGSEHTRAQVLGKQKPFSGINEAVPGPLQGFSSNFLERLKKDMVFPKASKLSNLPYFVAAFLFCFVSGF